MFLQTDPGAILTVCSTATVASTRERLCGLLWNSTGLPTNLQPEVCAGIPITPPWSGMAGLAAIHRLTVAMGYGLESRGMHFVPQKPARRFLVYHQGHDGGFELGREFIEAALAEGFDVAALAMPLKGPNPCPWVNLPGRGGFWLVSHEMLAILPHDEGHPLRFFVTPVIGIVNYAASRGFDRVSMTGYSGGGWTTTLAAALDTRIAVSVPVAGSLPMYLRSPSPRVANLRLQRFSPFHASIVRDWGDYEQWCPELIGIADYLDLYVLGAAGEGRRQLQIMNRYDPVTFSGDRPLVYRECVARAAGACGGAFDVWIDGTHWRHAISDEARARIFREARQR